MTHDEINAAIAEACGWRITQEDDGERVLRDPCGEMQISTWRPIRSLAEFQCLASRRLFPDYCNDLNAMREATLKVLYNTDALSVYFNLCDIDRVWDVNAGWVMTMDLPASNRAEAFLRAIGKWL